MKTTMNVRVTGSTSMLEMVIFTPTTTAVAEKFFIVRVHFWYWEIVENASSVQKLIIVRNPQNATRGYPMWLEKSRVCTEGTGQTEFT